MKRCRLINEFRVFCLLASILLTGCAASNSAPPATLTKDQFAALYNDEDAVTDVWYTGSDSQYHYFCMEHWTFKPDGSAAHLDSQKFYQVSVAEFGVKRPFAHTTDPQQWRLMRPKGMPPGTK
jgi:hypothetical protein